MTKSNRPTSLVEWLGFQEGPVYQSAIWLGPIIGAILVLLTIALVLAGVATLVHFFLALAGSSPYDLDDKAEAIRNIGLVMAALFGAPLIIWRSIVLAKQADISAAVLFNNKINDAANGLLARREVTRCVSVEGTATVLKEWEDDLVGRASAIDRFEGLVAENEEFAPRAVKILAAYIRGNFPVQNFVSSDPDEFEKARRLDLQKAIDSIGKILPMAQQVDSRPWRLDLTGCNLDRINFAGGNFRAVDFSKSRMEGSILNDGNFEGCRFNNCLLNYALFRGANIRGSRFDGIILNAPKSFYGSILEASDLTGITFIRSDISALEETNDPNICSRMFVTRDTTLNVNMEKYVYGIEHYDRAHLKVRMGDRAKPASPEVAASMDLIKQRGLLHWSPFNSLDGVSFVLLNRFRNKWSLTEWPFTN